jgi:hypothetical protein
MLPLSDVFEKPLLGNLGMCHGRGLVRVLFLGLMERDLD